MISMLQRIQSLSLNLKIILSVILIAVVTFLHIMTTPSLGIGISLSIDKIAHMMIFYFVGLWFLLLLKMSGLFFYFFSYADMP